MRMSDPCLPAMWIKAMMTSRLAPNLGCLVLGYAACVLPGTSFWIIPEYLAACGLWIALVRFLRGRPSPDAKR
jgi:hypothetical protein